MIDIEYSLKYIPFYVLVLIEFKVELEFKLIMINMYVRTKSKLDLLSPSSG